MSKPSRFLQCAFLFALALFPSLIAFAQAPVPSNPEIDRRVDAILQKMTVEQKIDYIGDAGFAVRTMPALGIPALEMSDGPLGVRSNQKFPSTTYAAGIDLAASWDPPTGGARRCRHRQGCPRAAFTSCSAPASTSTALP
jgi:beta-glucosidase-like glycosyl hydrolase